MKRLILFSIIITMLTGIKATANVVNIDSIKQEIIQTSKEINEFKKDSAILSKLNPEQLMQLKDKELEVRRIEVESHGRQEMPLNGFGVFMICLLPFLFVATVLIIQSNARNRESIRRYDLYMKSLEMGQPVPEHFFEEPKKQNPASNLKKGVLWLAIGLAITISVLLMKEPDILFFGVIPSFIGAGYLLVHYLEKPKQDETLKDDEQR